jgi:tetratricopeptide (TPR) repeat protein
MQQTKPILEELARARNHYHRHDVMRCMVSLATALKLTFEGQFVGRDKSLVENAVLEVVQLLNRTSEVRDHTPKGEGLGYVKGDFKSLFKMLLRIVKTIREEQKRESLEQTRARKLQMDTLLLRGGKALENKNLADAEEAFQEAATLYVDEHKLFYVIGNKLLAAGHPRLALKYLLQGLEKDPDPVLPTLAAAQACGQLKEYDKAEALLLPALKANPDPDLFLELAKVQAAANKLKQAYVNAGKALQMDPAQQAARRLMTQLRKKAAAMQKAGGGPARKPSSAPQNKA